MPSSNGEEKLFRADMDRIEGFHFSQWVVWSLFIDTPFFLLLYITKSTKQKSRGNVDIKQLQSHLLLLYIYITPHIHQIICLASKLHIHPF